MNRRMFLAAAGVGMAHPAGLLALGPALVRQVNRLTAEIEDLQRQQRNLKASIRRLKA